jgi:hypothetical protein
MRVENRKGRFSLRPDSIVNYRRLYVDVFSVAASLSQPEELFASAAEAGVNAVFVVDAWHESHMPLARRYLELCRRYGLDCRLSESKPAEIYAAELCDAECGEGCAVLTRDYDAVKAAGRCAVLIFQRGRFWRVEDISEPGGGRMDVVVYGVEDAPEGFRVVKSVEELRRYMGKAVIVVVGDEGLAEELGVVCLSREEWGEFVRRYGQI